MPRVEYTRPIHRQVHAVLNQMDSQFLAQTHCFFGGGTRIVLELGEYRESRDMDFLCSDRDGYRQIRESVTANTLGAIQTSDLSLAREVRSDQYGIRTFIEQDGIKLKFEIVREARIEVEGEKIAGIPVASLSHQSCFAEKFLANTDRGMDASTLSRDVVDLAFMIEGWSKKDADAGMLVAKTAYGDSVTRALESVLHKIGDDKSYRARCIDGLTVSDSRTLNSGIKALKRLLA